MKKIFISLAIVLCTLFGYSYASAATTPAGDWKVEVKISTDFTMFLPDDCSVDNTWDRPVYTCRVPKWVGWIEILMGNMIKYFTYIASLGAVLMLVVGWIMYSMAWVDQWAKDSAKKLLVMVLAWLILLLMSWVVLKAIAPWVYQ